MVSRKWKNGDYGLAKAWSRIRGHEGDGITHQSRGWDGCARGDHTTSHSVWGSYNLTP